MDMSQNERKRASLLCCRACLTTHNRLFSMHEYRLSDAFSSILGTPVEQDTLPQYLCVYCQAMLRKCVSFKNMCLRTQQSILAQLFKMDPDCTQRLNHPSPYFNLSISPVKLIDCISAEDIKVEPIIDTDDINSIQNTDLKIEDENDDEVRIDNDSAIDFPVVKHVNDSKKRKRKIGNTVKKKKKIEIEFDDEIDDVSTVDSDESYKCKKTRKQRKSVVKKETRDLKCDKIKRVKEVVRKNEKKMTKSASDDSAVESAYAVQIVHLSKEEQLEEIAARKKSRNYLESHYRCDDCGKGYDSETAFNNHLVRHSPSAGTLVCEICAMRFNVKCRLQKHEESHRLKFICKFGDSCNFVSRDRAHAKNHHAMHAGKTFECQHCGKTFNKGTTYLTHVRLTHPAMNVACDICGETFVSQKGALLHKNRMHPELQKHKCGVCSASFVSAEALSLHAAAGDHGARACEQCGENCASETQLQEHVEKAHPIEIHRCEECNMTFSTSASYDTHHSRKHLNEQSRRPRPPARKKYAARPRAPGQFVCEQCGTIKPNAALLRYHQRIHEGVKPFACEHCPKAFTLKSSLVWHTRTHTGEKPYQCAECPRAFSSKANFNRHHKTVHLGIRGQFPCSVCARVFTTRSDARVHTNAVHRGLPWPKRDRSRKKNTGLDNK
ncbi:zinc finger protein 845-like isoform X2 [Leguminivora glycinivorella]|uniref:zinc finger protein 845-like isoform X2 n=1 Tax=Leguminivora glycinivorella TaxID=1035111 RepID=UPI002010695E|nr:zinc finger protein 845-like isoform X2 [Leguminivora glycinivorella]